MLNILSLKCQNCNGVLEISPEMTSFACGYCGVSQIVERKGGTVSLKLVTDAISKVQIGTDKTAAELAIQRLKGEMQIVNTEFLRRDSLKGEELRSTLIAYFITFVIISIFFLYQTFISNYGILFFIAWIIVAVGMKRLHYKYQNSIISRHEPGIEEKAMEYKKLKERLAKEKEIADS